MDDLARGVRIFLTFFKSDPTVRELAEAFYDYHLWFKYQPFDFQQRVQREAARMLQQTIAEGV